MSILFQIKPSSGAPIYRQIIDQVKRMVMSGRLKPGDDMPSVRKLAGELEVNPMTISKAYSLLEETGFLERQRGKGMIISSSNINKQSIEARLESIEPQIQELITQASQLGIPVEKIIEEIKNKGGKNV